jgi:DNA-binding response OmpR family regulator
MVITALTEDSLEQELYDLGADKFFRKPLVLSDLIDAINAEVEAS